MTILVLDAGAYTFATEQWVAIEKHLEENVVIHAQPGPLELAVSMNEFLAIVADGGKVIDLRKRQTHRWG